MGNKNIKDILDIGGVVIHKTDTVCGISGTYLSEKAYKKIYKLKKRDNAKPLGVLLADFESISIFSDVSLPELEKIRPFLEKGMTIVVKRKSALPKHIVEQSENIAIRIPDHKETKELIMRCGPLISSSANITGFSPVSTKEESKKAFHKIQFLERGDKSSNTPSTILSFIDGITSLLEKEISLKKR